MDFTTEAQYEVIREAVSQKLDRPIFNTSHKFWRDSTQTKYQNSLFHIDDYLRYTNQVNNYMVELMNVN